MCCLHALQICKALHVSVQEHALIEQALANVLALRSVGGEALANRLKQLQAVGAEPFLAGCVCVFEWAYVLECLGCLPSTCVHCIPGKALPSC